MNAYATHFPVLEAVLEVVKPSSVVEFGSGTYSTEIFAKQCARLVTVEQQEKVWFDTVCKRYAGIETVEPLWLPGMAAVEWFASNDEIFDVVFVDGETISRRPLVLEGMKKSGIVIAHDTEHGVYNLSNLPVLAGWGEYVYRAHSPWTTVWSASSEVLAAVVGKLEE